MVVEAVARGQRQKIAIMETGICKTELKKVPRVLGNYWLELIQLPMICLPCPGKSAVYCVLLFSS
jgi:hypothetical protein